MCRDITFSHCNIDSVKKQVREGEKGKTQKQNRRSARVRAPSVCVFLYAALLFDHIGAQNVAFEQEIVQLVDLPVAVNIRQRQLVLRQHEGAEDGALE